jgi:hypothetical protein
MDISDGNCGRITLGSVFVFAAHLSLGGWKGVAVAGIAMEANGGREAVHDNSNLVV